LRVSYESTEEQSSSRREQKRAIRRTGNGTRKRAGKGTSGEPEAELAREPGKELRMRIENEVRKRTGNGTRNSIGDETRKGIGEDSRKEVQSETHAALRKLAAVHGTKSSYNECSNGRVWETRAPLVGPNNSEVTMSCDLETEPGLRKIGSLGEISKGVSPFAFLARYEISPIPQAMRHLLWQVSNPT
jgi:hypothetical protein